jgi:hypothetical protein
MSFLNTVKGWFNIGGVNVRLQGINPHVSRSGSQIDGSVLLSSKGDKHILKLTYRFLVRRKTGTGQQKTLVDSTIAEVVDTNAFDMTAGETKTLQFSIPYVIPKELYDQGGVIGAIGSIGATLIRARSTFHVLAVCDVRGTALDPMDMFTVELVD